MSALASNITHKPVLFSTMAASLCMLLGCNKPTPNTESAPAAAEQVEPVATSDAADYDYVIATQKNFKPFNFRGEDSKITGFDVDVMNAIAADQGFKVTYITVDNDYKFEGLESGTYDMLAAGITITEDRKTRMRFSDPYFTSQQAVMGLPSADKITDFSVLDNYQVAVKENTTSQRALKENMQTNPQNIRYVETPYIGVKAVIQDKVDYVMSDSPVLRYYANEDVFKEFDLQIYTDINYGSNDYGFAFPQEGSEELLQKVNAGLHNIKTNGAYNLIINKWFT